MLATLIRLQQRKEEINFSKLSGKCVLSFCRAVYTNLAEVQATDKTLFIYNQNRISEQEAFALWCFASEQETDNLLVSTDFRNHLGFLANKQFLSFRFGFVLSWGVYPALANQAKFSVAIMTFEDEKAPVDLLIPAPSFLEMTGTALSDLGQITKSANPAKSIIINELMRLFYTLNWINPNSAEVPFLEPKLEKLLVSLQELCSCQV